jgi:hypothetical protein
MVLFLIASMPLLFGLVTLLPWKGRQSPRPLALVSTFLKGVLLFFPGYLALLVVRGIFGFSYDGFFLFLSLLQRDHLFPLLAAVGGFLLIQRTLTIPPGEESVFLAVFANISGFLSMLNVADALRAVGTWDAYVLFILPSLRLGAALIIALAARRFYRWEGRDGAMFCAAAGVCAVGLTVSSYLSRVSLMGWGATLCAAVVLGSVVVFAGRVPRAVQG